MLSKRGATLRVVNGYKFRHHKYLAGDVERWVCTAKQCKSFMKIYAGNIIEENHNHNHDADSEGSLMRQKIANSCKRKATEELFDRPNKIMRKEIDKDALEVLTEADLVQIRKAIHSARAKVRPPLPSTLEELHESLREYELKTKLDEPFLLVNDDECHILMFSTDKNLKFLQSCDAILMDGTFDSCPKLFSQLFIVHGRKRDTYVPLAYFLLPSKTTEIYKRALGKLKTLLPADFAPAKVNVDFEQAIHTALKNVWPSVRIEGCRFHLSQAWFRKIQSLGLTKVYKSRSAEGSYLRSFFGLSFLDPSRIEDFFIEEFTQAEPDDSRIHEFSTYVYKNYISSTARFPPPLWTSYTSRISRTTNACESLHSRLNSMFYHAHPNIFILTDSLLEVQERGYTKMLSVNVTKQRKESAQKEDFIRAVMAELEDGTIDTADYVKKLSRKFLP